MAGCCLVGLLKGATILQVSRQAIGLKKRTKKLNGSLDCVSSIEGRRNANSWPDQASNPYP